VAKAMAMWEEPSLVNRLGCSKVIMESDSLDTFFLNKMGKIATFYLKKKKRIDQFISGEPAKNRTNAPISSWSTTTLGITTGRPGHMPTVGHTRQRQTTPTLTTSFAREICRTCADRVSTGHLLACTGKEAWWGESSAIFADCVDLASLIESVSFKYCPREANEATNELARSNFSNKLSSSWLDEPSGFILSRIVNDVSEGASFRCTFFLTRVPKGTGRFLMRRLASLTYYMFT
jgi:hypothetical protein